ncbi:XisH family protein [Candidatus Poribacteria bacterium]|nr:XisH family protein [Candidatus Poribacteria bacterium]
MPARDLFHDAAKNALIKEGWTITDDPLLIRFGGVDMYIDIAAERLIAAEKDGQKIAVEIKSFVGTSVISDFHTAMGQFINYRVALEAQEPERELYLAVPEDVYEEFFTLYFTRTVIQRYQLKNMVYNVDREEIVKWDA